MPGRDYQRCNVIFCVFHRERDIDSSPNKHVYLCILQAFTVTKMWCYKITSLILGVPCAVIWGIYFACLAFCTSWCCMPCIKSEVSTIIICSFLTYLKIFGIVKEIGKSFKLPLGPILPHDPVLIQPAV